jgi:pilus assembly protein CpaB
MGNWKASAPIALSLVIAVTGSYFLYRWIESQRQPKEVVQVQTEAVPVVVAIADLPWGTRLTPEMIKTSPYLKESLPAGHFANVNDLKNRVLLTPLKLNDPITEHKLAPTSIETGGVAAVLKPGKRAIAVKGDKVIGISGFINPGNLVDVLVTVKDPEKEEKKTKTILEKIPVLATGTQIQENEKGEPAPVDVYTLEVTLEEAEKLALAASEGKLQLALRSIIDGDEVYTEGITIPELLASYSDTKPGPVIKTKPVVKRTPTTKRIKRWVPRRTLSVEMIKGIEVRKKKFALEANFQEKQ